MDPYWAGLILVWSLVAAVVLAVLYSQRRRRPVWPDPELERLHGAVFEASRVHAKKLKTGELTVEDFTEDFNANVMPAIRAWEKAIEQRLKRL